MRFFALTRQIQSQRAPSKILQLRYFYPDFVPRDPKSTPKKYKYPQVYDPYGPHPPPSEKIVQLAERMASLSKEDLAQVGILLGERLSQPKLQKIDAEGVDFGQQTAAAAPKVEEKVEKTAFDVRLEKFDAASKIKVIKEVRALTNLGLKEAKELAEKAPVLLKQGLTKDEANDVIEKIKGAGGVVVMV